ncbi:MAG: 2-C-methyl-D-erythritol 4-phosphate cytidylyltransferase [Candidatus Dasytiphilus stammeri]
MIKLKNIKNITAIVPAAGIGKRMQLSYPKQYLTINGKTILEYALAMLLEHPVINRIIIVLNSNDKWFKSLPLPRNMKNITTIIGDNTRAGSVMAGLQAINKDLAAEEEESTWILIHDAVRPCLHRTDLDRLLSIRTVNSIGGILVTPVRDTIKRSELNRSIISYTITRNNLWHALTPQLFPLILLRKCLQQAFKNNRELTDDSSALEYCGYHPSLIIGRGDNIKITYQEDIDLAKFYIQKQKSEKT